MLDDRCVSRQGSLRPFGFLATCPKSTGVKSTKRSYIHTSSMKGISCTKNSFSFKDFLFWGGVCQFHLKVSLFLKGFDPILTQKICCCQFKGFLDPSSSMLNKYFAELRKTTSTLGGSDVFWCVCFKYTSPACIICTFSSEAPERSEHRPDQQTAIKLVVDLFSLWSCLSSYLVTYIVSFIMLYLFAFFFVFILFLIFLRCLNL